MVRPLLDQEFPGLEHAAALLGPGSEVLGFDTERSTDHDWGPRAQVFPGAADAERLTRPIEEMLAGRLPAAFRGYRSRSRSSATRRAASGTGSRRSAWRAG